MGGLPSEAQSFMAAVTTSPDLPAHDRHKHQRDNEPEPATHPRQCHAGHWCHKRTFLSLSDREVGCIQARRADTARVDSASHYRSTGRVE